MLRIVKKMVLGSFFVLCFSTLTWSVLLANPELSYTNRTQLNQLDIYHNDPLPEEAQLIFMEALELVQKSAIYDSAFTIELCLNDDEVYPNLHPAAAGLAYAFLNKAVVFQTTLDFPTNTASYTWEINGFEERKYKLSELLAHEFMHTLQYNADPGYYLTNTFGSLNWKLEGHAEYVSRGYQRDNCLADKIDHYLEASHESHSGIPVVWLADGTVQNLNYLKYALVVQYLIEERNVDFAALCAAEPDIEKHFEEMLSWQEKQRSL